MKFLFISISLSFCCLAYAKPQSNAGAKSAGMAYTALTNKDVYAAYTNTAASAFLSKHSIGLYTQNRFLVPNLNDYLLSYVFQNDKIGSFSSSLNYSGYSAFQNLTLGFGYARKFGERLSTGLKFNFHHLSIQENGSKQLFSLQASLYYQALEKLQIAVVVNNPIKQKLDPQSKESLSSKLALGLAYLPSEKLSLALQLSKDLKYPAQISIGVEYQLHKILFARFGTGINPMIVSGGIGLKLKSLNLDFASSWQQHLNYSPQLSIQYHFGK